MNNTCIVGAGKIAYSLTKALLDAGYNINSIISRKKNSSKKLAKRFNITCHTGSMLDVLKEPALFFLSVPDSEIENAANVLSDSSINQKDSVFIHLSGSIDISALSSLKSKGASVASMHIMQSFPSFEVVDIKGHYAAIETDDEGTRKLLFNIARRLELKPFSISSDNKVFYHLTGVFASNFIIANLFDALLAFEKSNIRGVSFSEIISPILETTLENIKKKGPVNALSGPIARGDIQTVKNHIRTLNEEINSEGKLLLESYLANSLTLLEAIRFDRGELTQAQEEIRKLIMNSINKEIKE